MVFSEGCTVKVREPLLIDDGLGGGVDRGHRAGGTALLPIVLIFLLQSGDIALAHDEDGGGGPGLGVGGSGSDDYGAIPGVQRGERDLGALFRIGFARRNAQNQGAVGRGDGDIIALVALQRQLVRVGVDGGDGTGELRAIGGGLRLCGRGDRGRDDQYRCYGSRRLKSFPSRHLSLLHGRPVY